MRANDIPFAAAVSADIAAWESVRGPLPGIVDPPTRDSLIRQLVDSNRRRLYIEHFRTRAQIPYGCADPHGDIFNPYSAAVVNWRQGHSDEALWLVFLAVHLGRHRVAGWRYVKNIYGQLGQGNWDWLSVSDDVASFRSWLSDNRETVRGDPPRGFGNHRKRETLADTGTGETVDSYVKWIGGSRGHEVAFAALTQFAFGDSGAEFELLYQSMKEVHRFGRLARFDYFTTASRLGFISAVAGRPYLSESTGPLAGARLLFGLASPRHLEEFATDFGNFIGIQFAVLEDAVCNWQKSPEQFTRFR